MEGADAAVLSPSGPSSASSTGGPRAPAWRGHSSSTAATSSTPRRCPRRLCVRGDRPRLRGRRDRPVECRHASDRSRRRGRDPSAAADRHVPKPALTLVDRPFLAYMVEWLAAQDVDRGGPRLRLPARHSSRGAGRGGPPRGPAALRGRARATGDRGAIRFAADRSARGSRTVSWR